MNSMHKYKLSIITVNKDNAKGLEKTIASILIAIADPTVEYIVVDGASEDTSLDIINHHKDIIDIAISEADTGPYDAMNKGLKLAAGEYIYFLNSGDELIFWDEKILSALTGPACYYFHVKTCDAVRNIRPQLGLYSLMKKTLNHQGVIYHTESLRSIGGYRVDYRVIADLISLWTFLAVGLQAIYLDDLYAVARYEGGGLSSGGISVQEKKRFFLMLLLGCDHTRTVKLKERGVAVSFFVRRFYRQSKRRLYRFWQSISAQLFVCSSSL